MYCELQRSELRLYIKRVNDFQFVVCLQIHISVGDTMNEKFAYNDGNCMFIVHWATVCDERCCEIIDHDSNYYDLQIKEVLHILYEKPSLNVQVKNFNTKLPL